MISVTKNLVGGYKYNDMTLAAPSPSKTFNFRSLNEKPVLSYLQP